VAHYSLIGTRHVCRFIFPPEAHTRICRHFHRRRDSLYGTDGTRSTMVGKRNEHSC